MKISKEELLQISERLLDLASECQYMHDEAKVASRLVGFYSSSSCQVVNHLRNSLRRADNLFENLRYVRAILDDLLIKDEPYQGV